MSENIQQQATEKLTQLGFTQLESDVYLFLLMQGPATGYRVAKGINKAIANVYKAVDSLALKGAITQAESDSKVCSAVPWKQFLASEKQQYLSNLDSLSEYLAKLPTQQKDEQLHQLRNANQVNQQCLELIDNAQQLLLAEIQPDAVDTFSESLIAAAERGVEVRVKVYEAVDLPGVKVTLRDNGQEVYAKTQDIEFTFCADGKELVTALLSADGKTVIQAWYTRSSLMNTKLHCGLIYELILTELKQVIPAGDIEAAQQILQRTAHLHPYSNENIIFEQFDKSYQAQRHDAAFAEDKS